MPTSSTQGAVALARGMPYWRSAACADDADLLSRLGYTNQEGRAATCTELANAISLGFCSRNPEVELACMQTCDRCAAGGAGGAQSVAARDRWRLPWAAKNYTTTGNCSAAQLDVIQGTERAVRDTCAAVLHCLQTKTEAACQDRVRVWFGGTTAPSDASNWEQLRVGFTKVCSANRASYNCAPLNNCGIYYDEGNMQYLHVQQSSVPEDERQSWITKCHSGRCSYSGSVAWVHPGKFAVRTINLCPMLFWVGSSERRAGLVIHELSMFQDMANTVDTIYDRNRMKIEAQTEPWKYITNGPTWEAFAVDLFSRTGSNITWDDILAPSSAPSPTIHDNREPVPTPTPAHGCRG